jgi:ribonuclease Z
MSLDGVPHAVEACFPAESREFFTRLRHAALFRDVARLAERPVAAEGTVIEAGPYRMEARKLSHSVPAIGYRLVEADGRRMLPGRLAAFGIAGPDIGRLQREGRLRAGDRTVGLEEVSERRPGQRVAFVMDTRLCDAAFALADRADMLICESTFGDAEAGLAREYGHLTAREAGRIAAEAGARLLVLTHFSQRYDHSGVAALAGQAASVFGGDIVLAADLDRIGVPRRG